MKATKINSKMKVM